VLLNLLAQADKPVQTLAEQAGLTLANASAQLKVLESAALVRSRKQGRQVFYELAGPAVTTLMEALRQTGQAVLPEIREVVTRYFEDPQSLLELTERQLLREVRGGRVVLIDLRPADDFAAGHLPGAISLPATELEKHLSTLPRRRRVVAYCRGPYCVTAVNAVNRLRSRGIKAVRAPWSVAQWKVAGLPVEVGPPPRKETP
jgi:rhodanese-related sulfurtransferase